MSVVGAEPRKVRMVQNSYDDLQSDSNLQCCTFSSWTPCVGLLTILPNLTQARATTATLILISASLLSR